MSETKMPIREPDAPVQNMDAAQRSLSDAMKVSFTLLKIAMIILVIIYCFSGFFSVDTQEKAVRLQFGQIVGDPGKQVYESGFHFGLPFPIGDVVRVKTSSQTVSVNKAFWYEITEGNKNLTADERAVNPGPLNPEKDGSLLTGDANIVHARFEVNYVISNIVDYVANVGTPQMAEVAVLAAAEHGIVHAVAQVTADELIGGRLDREVARRLTQLVLDNMKTGITIQAFSVRNTTMPMPVVEAYQAVSNAESEKAQKIEAARKEYSRILSEAAGQARNDIYQLVRQFEEASAVNDPKRLAALQAELDEAFANPSLRMSAERGGLLIGGTAAQIVNEAKTYRTQAVETVKAEAQTFKLLHEEYKRNPRILVNRLLEDAREAVFTGDIETIYAPTGNLIIETNRDPDVERKREEERLRDADRRRREAQQKR